MTGGQGPGRRLTDDEEAQAAGMFAAKATDRAVADALGIGTGTANRLRHRLADRITALAASGNEQPAGHGPLEMTAFQPSVDYDAQLAELHAARGQLAEVVATHEARAAASRAAVTQLEVERREALAAGRDAQPLRSRRRDSEDDAQDSEDAAALAREPLAEADRQIAEVTARQALAQMRAELADAAEQRAEVYGRSGGRQRAAVVQVAAAAADFTAAITDEREAGARVDRALAAAASLCQQLGEPGPAAPPVPPSTALAPAPFEQHAGGGLALVRAIFQAHAGNTRGVAQLLGEVNGWLPADPQPVVPVQAAPVGPRPAPVTTQPEHWPATVGLDEYGRPILPPDPPMAPNRHPSGIPFWPR